MKKTLKRVISLCLVAVMLTGVMYIASQILTALPTADGSTSCPLAQYNQNVTTSIASVFKTLIK